MKNITDEMIEKFKKQLERDEKSKNTIEKYMRDICAFKEWIKADRFGVFSAKATCSLMPFAENTLNHSRKIQLKQKLHNSFL